MANNKVEQILTAVTELLKVPGLAATGGNVERGRFYPVSETVAAALTVRQGSREPVGEPNIAYQDALLEVVIAAHAKGADDTVEAILNQIEKEVYAAMMADRQLGLGFVHDTYWSGTSEPSLEAMEKPATGMDITFTVHFRHSYTDLSL